MYKFLLERNGRPYFTEVPRPQKEWDTVKAAFENALEHEKIVTDRINQIMSSAIAESDHATSSFYSWFVDEQVEEESNVDTVIKKLKLMKESSEGLFMLDKDMAARVFTPPPDFVF